jgi:ABC-type polar amino acid transport system ATPase subunit
VTMQPSLNEPFVSLRNVEKHYGAMQVLHDISFDVMKGDIVCIIGPSGSRKSTLLRCINALVPISRGSTPLMNFSPSLARLARAAGAHLEVKRAIQASSLPYGDVRHVMGRLTPRQN